MKKQFISLVLLLSTFSFAQVGIGTTTPNASAILDLTSTSKGLLPPRMNTEQRNLISNPPEGLTIYNTNLKSLETYNGLRWINYRSITSTDVLNPITDQIWMDRNLGAAQVATSSTDFNAYGSLFQWGRAADGHQLINWTSATAGTAVNVTTATLSGDDTPDDMMFILSSSLNDWRSPQNNNLWQGVNGTNNPCSNGYRLPTEAEWNLERLSWASQNAAGGFASSLKLTMPGYRRFNTGAIEAIGNTGYYWTSTVFGNISRYMGLSSASVGIPNNHRAYGFSIRCIKN
jgi:uncharacterized protein (TIGR02145 family)